jgi:tRNA 2-(methylsulfanyl)-N6-isopentenyladenosine37 hydroxylase
MAVGAALVAAARATEFQLAPTPDAWLDAAPERLAELLVDHANCELKAASTALGFLYRYSERQELAQRMSRLAREELRHYEQVRRIISNRGERFVRLTASRYAGGLRAAVREEEPGKLLDLLLVAALIEARSCERFAALAPRLSESLGRFYAGLLESEARHFENYIALARCETGASDEEVDARLVEFRAIDAQLITAPDPQFRFHSGVPCLRRDRG